MLIGIHPLLSPDLLYALRAMGHGDEIVIADANFPGSSKGPNCIRLDGADACETLKAILSVMPLDAHLDCPAHTMRASEKESEVPPIVEAFQGIVNESMGKQTPLGHIERFDFYERVNRAFAVVQTGELRLYGNIILTKGVVIS